MSPLAEPTTVKIVSHPERGPLAMAAKRFVQGLFFLLVTPKLLAYRLMTGLVGRDRAFLGASESMSQFAGQSGVYARQAFYRATLAECGRDVYFGWLSTFSMPDARVGEGVYIGRRCGLGFVELGDEVMLADGVQILSGGREHGVGGEGSSHRSQAQRFEKVRVGHGAWIGAGAIIMADVGAGAIVGAGAVVTKPIPPRSLAVGVPAKVIKTLG